MKGETTEVSWKGKWVRVPSVTVEGVTLLLHGGWLKTARVKDELWLGGDVVGDPEAIIAGLKTRRAADLFVFGQKTPGTAPRYPYAIEWGNVAAVRTESFDAWWGGLPRQSKQNIKRAEREGVVVSRRELDDEFIEGIVRINNESPVRQGRHFWHYGKDFAAVKRDYSDFLDRSYFLAAHYGDEMIGFLRLIDLGEVITVLQLLCLNAECQRRPANALISKAVELCVEKGARYFVYGQFVYGDNVDSSLTEFKRRNGFEQFQVPTYHVPLTAKARAALAMNLHKGVRAFVPRRLWKAGRELRRRLYAKKREEAGGGNKERGCQD